MLTALLHFGSLGDIIYSISTARALFEAHGHPINYVIAWGGKFAEHDLMIHPFERYWIDETRALQVADLLRHQPWFENIQLVDYQTGRSMLASPDRPDIHHVYAGGVLFKTGCPLPEHQFVNLGVHTDLAVRWIDLPDEVPVVARFDEPPIIVARSQRYRNQFVNYTSLIPYARIRPMHFVGLPDEYYQFCEAYGDFLPHLVTETVMELAHVIDQAGMFVGNQSMPYVLADGLKTPRVLEVCTRQDHARPYGPTGYTAINGRQMDYVLQKAYEDAYGAPPELFKDTMEEG